MNTEQILGSDFKNFCALIESTVPKNEMEGLNINKPKEALLIIDAAKTLLKKRAADIKKELENNELPDSNIVCSIRDRLISLNNYATTICKVIENEQREMFNVLKEIDEL